MVYRQIIALRHPVRGFDRKRLAEVAILALQVRAAAPPQELEYDSEKAAGP